MEDKRLLKPRIELILSVFLHIIYIIMNILFFARYIKCLNRENQAIIKWTKSQQVT